ncbi:GNAT family N-acetyltransferase [Bacillus songklensis]|uniref:GNAT family N-acetyltransferase n=2 Tax=Bacillus songklensis TaxID=1069116 RepID=A0ABV8B2P2_9BACI
MGVLYRKANIYDYNGILFVLREADQLHTEAVPDMFPADQVSMPPYTFQSYVSSPSNVVIVAELNGYIIGYSFAQLYYTSSPSGGEERCSAFIDFFGVKKEYHGLGIALGLFEQTKKWAQKKKADFLQLNVWHFNKRAIRFYEKQGMEPVSVLMHLPLKRGG